MALHVAEDHTMEVPAGVVGTVMEEEEVVVVDMAVRGATEAMVAPGGTMVMEVTEEAIPQHQATVMMATGEGAEGAEGGIHTIIVPHGDEVQAGTDVTRTSCKLSLCFGSINYTACHVRLKLRIHVYRY